MPPWLSSPRDEPSPLLSSSSPPSPPLPPGHVALPLAKGSHDDGGDPGPQCELLDQFAIAVQMLMGAVVLMSLLVKRYRESPRRPMRVWLCDVSKQAFGASFVHGLNVLISLVAGASPESHSGNPCVYYFLNVAMDTTVGVYVLFLWLRLAHALFTHLGVTKGLRSGRYGNPPKFVYWARQTAVFSGCLFLMKLCVALALWGIPLLEALGKLALEPIAAVGGARAEVLFVMLVFPIVMNVIQFWLIDSTIKHRGNLDAATAPTFAAPDNSDTEDDDEAVEQDGFGSRPPARRGRGAGGTRPSGGAGDDEDAESVVEDYLSDTSLLTSTDGLMHATTVPEHVRGHGHSSSDALPDRTLSPAGPSKNSRSGQPSSTSPTAGTSVVSRLLRAVVGPRRAADGYVPVPVAASSPGAGSAGGSLPGLGSLGSLGAGVARGMGRSGSAGSPGGGMDRDVEVAMLQRDVLFDGDANAAAGAADAVLESRDTMIRTPTAERASSGSR